MLLRLTLAISLTAGCIVLTAGCTKATFEDDLEALCEACNEVEADHGSFLDDWQPKTMAGRDLMIRLGRARRMDAIEVLDRVVAEHGLDWECPAFDRLHSPSASPARLRGEQPSER